MASHSNENQTDAKYTDIEVIEQPELSSTESRFKLAHIVINSIRSHWEENGKFKLIITALGIFLSYIIVGILQEKIMRGCYSDKNGICNRFTFAITLVGVQFIFSFTFIKGIFLRFVLISHTNGHVPVIIIEQNVIICC